jgi:hypothetical protein
LLAVIKCQIGAGREALDPDGVQVARMLVKMKKLNQSGLFLAKKRDGTYVRLHSDDTHVSLVMPQSRENALVRDDK